MNSTSPALTGADGTIVRLMRSHARLVMGAAWGVFIVLAGLYYAAVALDFPAVPRFLVMETIYCAPIIATIVLSFVSSRRSSGSEKRFWQFLSGAMVVLLLCELLLIFWIFVINPTGPPRVSWPFHALHGVAAICFIGLLLSMTRFAEEPLLDRVRHVIDALAVTLIAAVALLVWYVRPVMSPYDPPVSHLLLGVAYPVFGLVMLLGTLFNVVGMKLERWRVWEILTAISLGIYALAISLWPTWYTTAEITSRNYERGLLDLIQFAGQWLLMMAAVVHLSQPVAAKLAPISPQRATRTQISGIVVPVAIIVAFPVIAWLTFGSLGDQTALIVYSTVLGALTALMIARSITVALEHGVLFHRSVTDPLTGVYNHRYFHERLAIELSDGLRYDEHFALLVLDIDDFSRHNAVVGHMHGDRLLADVAAVVAAATPSDSLVARLGGDEFAILVRSVEELDALAIGRRILDVVEIEAGDTPGEISASMGIALAPAHTDDPQMLFRLTDAALFEAKRSGKNRVVIYDSERIPDLNPAERIDRLRRQERLAAVRALTAVVEARDHDGLAHATRVASTARAIATYMGMEDRVVNTVEAAALLHDLGMLSGTAPAVQTTGASAPALHASTARVLVDAGLGDLGPAVRSHHERWDGRGSPDHLSGEEIAIEARILAVSEAFEQLTSGEHDHDSERAIASIMERAGTEFDPRIVEALRAVVKV